MYLPCRLCSLSLFSLNASRIEVSSAYRHQISLDRPRTSIWLCGILPLGVRRWRHARQGHFTSTSFSYKILRVWMSCIHKITFSYCNKKWINTCSGATPNSNMQSDARFWCLARAISWWSLFVATACTCLLSHSLACFFSPRLISHWLRTQWDYWWGDHMRDLVSWPLQKYGS